MSGLRPWGHRSFADQLRRCLGDAEGDLVDDGGGIAVPAEGIVNAYRERRLGLHFDVTLSSVEREPQHWFVVVEQAVVEDFDACEAAALDRDRAFQVECSH